MPGKVRPGLAGASSAAAMSSPNHTLLAEVDKHVAKIQSDIRFETIRDAPPRGIDQGGTTVTPSNT